MKNIATLAAFAAFSVMAMISSVTIAAPAGSSVAVESITAAILVPMAQETPVNLALN